MMGEKLTELELHQARLLASSLRRAIKLATRTLEERDEKPWQNEDRYAVRVKQIASLTESLKILLAKAH